MPAPISTHSSRPTHALKPRWTAFLMVCFGGGLRWGEATARRRVDVDWARERVHVARTWSEDGGRIEACKDGEDRWVKLPPATLAALQAHTEAMELEASLRRWTPEQRDLIFPNTVGRITRYGTFLELVWQPLLRAAQLPYRKPHAMRHSYATWMLEAGADLRWVKDQLGHASIEETEGTYGHLERERHEGRVDLDAVLGGVHARPPASTPSDAGDASEGQLRDIPREVFLVEGKGFRRRRSISLETLALTLVQIDAKLHLSRHPAPQVFRPPCPWSLEGLRRRGSGDALGGLAPGSGRNTRQVLVRTHATKKEKSWECRGATERGAREAGRAMGPARRRSRRGSGAAARAEALRGRPRER